MPEHIGVDSFVIGSAFPAHEPAAIYVMVVSTALNDLITTSRWFLGPDGTGPRDVEMAIGERHYFLRLSIAHLMEFRTSTLSAVRQPEVAAFLGRLDDGDPDRSIATGLANLKAMPGAQPWVKQAMIHVRNQTFHYGGDKYNEWEQNRWAMAAASTLDGQITYASETMAGMRLEFADEVVTQHFFRKVPELVDDPHLSLDEETMRTRFRHLSQCTSDLMSTALAFGHAVVAGYVDKVDAGIVRSERAPGY